MAKVFKFGKVESIYDSGSVCASGITAELDRRELAKLAKEADRLEEEADRRESAKLAKLAKEADRLKRLADIRKRTVDAQRRIKIAEMRIAAGTLPKVTRKEFGELLNKKLATDSRTFTREMIEDFTRHEEAKYHIIG